jgi:glycosyltransferase involved in cell wall biosynthesis
LPDNYYKENYLSIRNITVFSQGDSSSSKTWSNIPYYLTNTLRNKGINVNAINVEPKGILRVFYDKFLCRILRHTFWRDTTYTYERSRSFQRAVNAKMKTALKAYPNTDVFISTSFSFHPGSMTEKPCILFCDWNYEFLISQFKEKSPDWFEKKGISIQDRVIQSADLVVSLFPNMAQYMSEQYPNTKVLYLGNVINSEPFEISINELGNRFGDPHIIFVGMPRYINGLTSLIEAVTSINNNGTRLGLDIIGMNQSDVSSSTFPSYIRFHGYLEKSKDNQLEQYNSLMKSALAFINTTPQWAGFSSTLEAMYFGLPVYTSRYHSFVETFGSSLNFGDYCESNNPKDIETFISSLLKLSQDEYVSLCQNARKKAEPFTWSAYVDKLISKIETELL